LAFASLALFEAGVKYAEAGATVGALVTAGMGVVAETFGVLGIAKVARNNALYRVGQDN
jgi:hypothetical protein